MVSHPPLTAGKAKLLSLSSASTKTKEILGTYATVPAVKALLCKGLEMTPEELENVTQTCESSPKARARVTVLEKAIRTSKRTAILGDPNTSAAEPKEVAMNMDMSQAFALREILSAREVWPSRQLNNVFSDLVEIRVGESDEVFKVHKKYLIRIPYFNNCFNGLFKEADTRIARLPEDIPQVFERIIDYVYSGLLSSQLISSGKSNWHGNASLDDIDDSLAEDVHDKATLFIEVYFLADKLCIEELSNKVVDRLYTFTNVFGVECRHLEAIWDRGVANERLKGLYLPQIAFNMRQQTWEETALVQKGVLDFFSADAEKAMELARALVEYNHHHQPSKAWNDCKWHAHRTTSSCPSPGW